MELQGAAGKVATAQHAATLQQQARSDKEARLAIAFKAEDEADLDFEGDIHSPASVIAVCETASEWE